MLTEKTSKRVFRAYLQTLYRSPVDRDGIGGTALVMFAIAALGVVIGLLT